MQRAAWMSARARNAARRGALIATIGGAAVVATLLALVLLPREVDRAIRAQLNAVPATRDSIVLLGALESARVRAAAAQAIAVAPRVTVATSTIATATPGRNVGADSSAIPLDSTSADLQQRINRARVSPLVESYRALVESRLLRDDPRIRAIVDSIEQVDREREAYAALGGADARYATLTARLAALGQRAVRIGEAQLSERQAPKLSTAGAPSTTAPTDSTSGAVVQRTSLLALRAPTANPALVASAHALADTVTMLQRTIDQTRRSNVVLDERRAAIRARIGRSAPPIAMLFSALIVGLALGYAGALVRELRRPTVGDDSEVERLAQARVITHHGAPDVMRDARTRRRADRELPPALVPTAEAWQQLHLTLTGLGDEVRAVRVVSDQPLLANALAINLAAAAARESRATLIIEPPTRAPLLALLLRHAGSRGLHDVQQGRVELREVVIEVPMGRHVTVDVLFSGKVASGAPSVENLSDSNEEVRRMAARYDLTLIVGDASSEVGVMTHDVIVCARLGVTSLEWLSRVTQQARGGNYRLRAVLLWAADSPAL